MSDDLVEADHRQVCLVTDHGKELHFRDPGARQRGERDGDPNPEGHEYKLCNKKAIVPIHKFALHANTGTMDQCTAAPHLDELYTQKP